MKSRKMSLFIATMLLTAMLGAALGAAAQAAERTVKVAITSTSFAWFPLYVALGANYFKDEGVEVQIVNVPSTTTSTAALLNGSVDLAGVGVWSAASAKEKGQPIRILTPMVTEYTPTMFVRRGLMEQAGLTRASPIADKVRFMVGKKLATTAIGAGPHLMYRYLFKRYLDGADVDKLAEVLPIGDAGPTLAAMKRGAIDVSAFSPPVPEKAAADGIGDVLIDFIGGDVPELSGVVFAVMAVAEDKLGKDGPTIAAFVRAIQRANKLAHNDIAAAGNAARSYFSSTEAGLYQQAVRAMQPALPKTAAVSVKGVEVFINLMVASGYKLGNVDVNAMTANDFVRDALAGRK